MQALSEAEETESRGHHVASQLVSHASGIALVITALSLALRQVHPARFARFWDDALFFRRVAYNIVHHGTAAWNTADKPVFVNTSQLFQFIAAALLALFPHHYNAAVIFWSAACIAGCWWFSWQTTSRGPIQGLWLFCSLNAPLVLLTITTGMETATVLLVLSAFLYATFREAPVGETARRSRLLALTALQLLVALARPDALLLSLTTGVGLLAVRGDLWQATKLLIAALLSLGLLALAFRAYYGTPVPLAAYLKISPVSAYDHAYLSLDAPNKQMNLAQLGLMLVPLLPLLALRLDRENLVLCGAALAFVGFQGLTTYEIMGYHARFYAPALPFFFAAGARNLERASSAWSRCLLIFFGLLGGVLATVAYRHEWIETDVGMAAVTLQQYWMYFVGAPLAGALLFFKPRLWPTAALLCATVLAGYQLSAIAPHRIRVVTDEDSDLQSLKINWGQGGLDIIKKCFPETVTVMHSELGLPGVFLPEGRVVDFSGLANPA
ncbi:MAG TPA: hypothetical protein VG963_18740, partial [Polyangiaceae bacterium]|nr:hypothetical protein [Polyangiaceae bacterium]